MRSRSYTIIIFLLMACDLQIAAQAVSRVTGTVLTPAGEPVGSVTISLYRATDSVLVKTDLTDESGRYEVALPAGGMFWVNYSAVGYAVFSSPVFMVKQGELFTVQAVRLRLNNEVLTGVTISARKPLVEVRPDRTVFHVQQSVTAAGSNGLELLQKSPGVSVDNNDNISIKGKTGIRVYVDGKMLALGAEDLAAYLRNLHSNDMEAIEIMTNPGVRYDASGNAGIVNIRLKKNTSLGANASVTGGFVQGITPKGSGGLSLNYRNRKVNVFSNVNGSRGKYQTDIVAPRIQKDTLYDQRLLQLSDSKGVNAKAGVDLFIDQHQTAGAMATVNYNHDDWSSYGSTAISSHTTGAYLKELRALNEIPRRRTSVNTNLNYRFADTSGREINVDADYGLYRGRAHSYQPNYYIDKSGQVMHEVITYNNTPTNIDIFTLKVDMVHRAWKGLLSYGVKASYVKTDNTLDFFNGVGNEQVFDAERSYRFTYKENVNAGHVSWQRQYGPQWNVQVGARVEQTNSESLLNRADGIVQADGRVKKSYLDLFPNVTVTLHAGKKHRFSLGYGRRIDRPNYQGLNPFELKLDELSYVKGNAFLRPQYTDNTELSHTWNNSITTTLGYSHVRDLATQTVDTLNNFTYAYSRNIATQDIYSIGLNLPLSFASWWNGFANLWANYQVYKGDVNGHSLDVELPAFGAVAQQSFTLGHDYTAELTGWFNGPAPLTPTLKAQSMGAVDIGLQKLLFHRRGTFKIAVTDVFKTAIPVEARTDFGGVYLHFWVNRESRTLRLNFTYRLGNNKVKGARQRQTGLENEVRRIKES